MDRFAATPCPRKGPSAEPFAAQLALSRVHPCLVALERTPGGYAMPRAATRAWFELDAKRGLAGYGLSRALRILLDVLAGLTALEDTRTQAGQSFVHGELVPAMVRVDPLGTARLIPLAPRHWAGPGTLPAPERCGHLAPERLLGDALDARADVFSAGVLLWEALAGRRLFETDSPDSIVTRLMGEKVALPQLPPELSWAVPLKAVALRALSVDPEQRFANCAELAEAIETVAGQRLATHTDVANYFGAPHLAARPSVIARPPRLPAHPSSLSALVAPVQPSAPAESSSSESVSRAPLRSERRAIGPIWAIAAIACLLSAFAGGAFARYKGLRGAAHSATQSSAPLAEALPTADPLRSAVPAPSSSAVPDPVAPLPAPSAPPSGGHEQASKTLKAPKAAEATKATKAHAPKAHAPKALAPAVRVPTKAVRSGDKTAAKYGI